MTEQSTRWPLRATFAHWVLGLISPWLELAPYEEPPDEPDPYDLAYEAGMQHGHEQAREDQRREEGMW